MESQTSIVKSYYNIKVSNRSTFILAAALAVLGGCRANLPDLPQVDAGRFQPGVRAAIESAQQAARAKPRDAAAVAHLGMTFHAHDQFAAAARCYERASLLAPSRTDYLYYWGTALAADGKNAEAIPPLRRAVASDNRSAVRLRLADALLASGQTKEAANEYRRVLELSPDTASAHYGLGRTQSGSEAIASFEKALALFPRYGAAQFALAGAYRRAGRGAEADELLKTFEQNRKAVPPVEDPWMAAVYQLDAGATGLLRQSQALESQGRLEEAAALQERALEQDPKLDQAWVNLIPLRARLGRPAEAEAAFRKAIELAPNRADAWYNFGVLCLETDRVEEARRAFEKAAELDPRNPDALHNLGSIIERTGQFARAASLYERALALNPEHRAARFQLARILANQHRYADAIANFEKLQQPVDERTPTVLYALGATHARAGHRLQAVEYLRRAESEAARRGQQQLATTIARDLAKLR